MDITKKWSEKRHRFYSCRTMEDRFFEKVDKHGDDECWPWNGASEKNSNNRAKFFFNGKMTNAARVAVILAGEKLKDGDVVCHRCDNPNCVNPKHLYVGTYSDNINDAYERGQQKRTGRTKIGEDHPNSSIKDVLICDVRTAFATGNFTFETLAKHFAISKSTAHRIVRMKDRFHD